MASPLCIKEIILEANSKAHLIKEFDKALVGTGKIYGSNNYTAVYDITTCIQILINEHGMDEIEALEHFTTIIETHKPCDNKPLFINDFRKIKELKKNI